MAETGHIEGFSPESVISKLIQRYTERLKKSPLSPEDQAGIVDLMSQFTEIASQLIAQQQEDILVQGEAPPKERKPLPFDGPRARQAMFLFSDAVYYTLIKCHKMKIPKELHIQFSQQVAQQVFEEAKRLILTVHYEQSDMSKKDQIQFMNQTALKSLRYFVGEYKKQAETESGGNVS